MYPIRTQTGVYNVHTNTKYKHGFQFSKYAWIFFYNNAYYIRLIQKKSLCTWSFCCMLHHFSRMCEGAATATATPCHAMPQLQQSIHTEIKVINDDEPFSRFNMNEPVLQSKKRKCAWFSLIEYLKIAE